MSYAAAFLLGAMVAAAALAVCIRYAPVWGLMDIPGGRKLHKAPTPMVGGIGIVAALGATLVYKPIILNGHVGFLTGVLILMVLGVWDDLRPLPARLKLLTQAVACSSAMMLDHVLIGQLGADVFGMPMGLGVVSVPFTLLVMLTVVNGLNLVDGVDGLAGGFAAVCLVLFAKASVTAGLPLDGLLVCGISGGLCLFLCLNFPLFPRRPARVFLGDGGSLVLGFALVYFAIDLSAVPHRVFRPTTALWFFVIPVYDAVWLCIRRSWCYRQPFRAGRDHLHHFLMRRWTGRATAIALVGAVAALAGASYLLERMGVGPMPHLIAWVAGFILYGVFTQAAWRSAWASPALERRPAPARATAEGKPLPEAA